MTGAGVLVRLPHAHHVHVPAGDRRAAATAATLHAPSRRLAVLGHVGIWASLRLVGPRLLGRSAATEVLTLPRSLWEHWRDRFGPFDHVGLYTQPQRSRSGRCVLLLRGGTPVAFVKLRSDPDPLEREHTALAWLAAHPAGAFRAPVPLGCGSAGDLHWLAQAPLPPRPHRSASPATLAAVASAVPAALSGALPDRPPRPGWEPMHGDLSPWNVRRPLPGAVHVVDWERLGWGPPAADATLLRAIVQVLAGRRAADRLDLPTTAEAAAFWLEEVTARPSTDHDAPVNQRLDAVLRALLDR